MSNEVLLGPTVIASLNAQREGLGDELSKRLKDGVSQAVDDYLTDVVQEANDEHKMEGPVLQEITKAAVLALVATTGTPSQLDAEARKNAGAGSALGRLQGRGFR